MRWGFRNLAGAALAVLSTGAAMLEPGVSSVDAGCTQINLRHHPAAFAYLKEAFDPVANVR